MRVDSRARPATAGPGGAWQLAFLFFQGVSALAWLELLPPRERLLLADSSTMKRNGTEALSPIKPPMFDSLRLTRSPLCGHRLCDSLRPTQSLLRLLTFLHLLRQQAGSPAPLLTCRLLKARLALHLRNCLLPPMACRHLPAVAPCRRRPLRRFLDLLRRFTSCMVISLHVRALLLCSLALLLVRRCRSTMAHTGAASALVGVSRALRGS